MTKLIGRRCRIYDDVRDSKIHWDVLSKIDQNFDADQGRQPAGRVFPRTQFGEIDECYQRSQIRSCKSEYLLRTECGSTEKCLFDQQSTQTFNTKVKLPGFDGSSLTLDFLDWFDTIEDYFEAVTPPDAMKCRLVAAKLKGEAGIWWKEVQNHRFSEGKNSITSWIMMRGLLIEKFLPSSRLTYFHKEKTEGIMEHTNCLIKVPSESHSSKPVRNEADIYVTGGKADTWSGYDSSNKLHGKADPSAKGAQATENEAGQDLGVETEYDRVEELRGKVLGVKLPKIIEHEVKEVLGAKRSTNIMKECVLHDRFEPNFMELKNTAAVISEGKLYIDNMALQHLSKVPTSNLSFHNLVAVKLPFMFDPGGERHNKRTVANNGNVPVICQAPTSVDSDATTRKGTKLHHKENFMINRHFPIGALLMNKEFWEPISMSDNQNLKSSHEDRSNIRAEEFKRCASEDPTGGDVHEATNAIMVLNDDSRAAQKANKISECEEFQPKQRSVQSESIAYILELKHPSMEESQLKLLADLSTPTSEQSELGKVKEIVGSYLAQGSKFIKDEMVRKVATLLFDPGGSCYLSRTKYMSMSIEIAAHAFNRRCNWKFDILRDKVAGDYLSILFLFVDSHQLSPIAGPDPSKGLWGLNHVTNDQNLKASSEVKIGIRLEMKLFIDGHTNLTSLILGGCMIHNHLVDVSAMLLFDPGGSHTAKKFGYHLFPNYGIYFGEVMTRFQLVEPNLELNLTEYATLEILFPKLSVGDLIGHCIPNTSRIDEYVYSLMMLDAGAKPVPIIPDTIYQSNTLLQEQGCNNGVMVMLKLDTGGYRNIDQLRVHLLLYPVYTNGQSIDSGVRWSYAIGFSHLLNIVVLPTTGVAKWLVRLVQINFCVMGIGSGNEVTWLEDHSKQETVVIVPIDVLFGEPLSLGMDCTLDLANGKDIDVLCGMVQHMKLLLEKRVFDKQFRQGWKDIVDNTNTEGLKKTLKLFYKLVNGLDPPRDVMMSMQSLKWNLTVRSRTSFILFRGMD